MCFDTCWVEGAKMMSIDTLSLYDPGPGVLAINTLHGDPG